MMPSGHRDLRTNAAIVVAISLIAAAPLLLTQALPNIAAELGTAPADAAHLTEWQFAGFIGAIGIGGCLVDGMGARMTFRLGLGTMAVAGLATSWMPSIATLAATQWMAGLGAGIAVSAITAFRPPLWAVATGVALAATLVAVHAAALFSHSADLSRRIDVSGFNTAPGLVLLLTPPREPAAPCLRQARTRLLAAIAAVIAGLGFVAVPPLVATKAEGLIWTVASASVALIATVTALAPASWPNRAAIFRSAAMVPMALAVVATPGRGIATTALMLVGGVAALFAAPAAARGRPPAFLFAGAALATVGLAAAFLASYGVPDPMVLVGCLLVVAAGAGIAAQGLAADLVHTPHAFARIAEVFGASDAPRSEPPKTSAALALLAGGIVLATIETRALDVFAGAAIEDYYTRMYGFLEAQGHPDMMRMLHISAKIAIDRRLLFYATLAAALTCVTLPILARRSGFGIR